MKYNKISFIPLIAALAALPASAQQVETQPKLFDGFYGGAEVSLQRVYSGAFIDNLDILQDESRMVGSLLLGWRHQFDSGLVLGLEGQFGLTDGNLTRREQNRDLTINYQNSSQLAAGLTLGYAFGSRRDWLIYSYAIATQRDFDLDITLGSSAFTQEDGMGVLRYGLGLEHQWQSGWGVRASVGSNYTDFRDLVTNMDVNGKLEVSAALIYQF